MARTALVTGGTRGIGAAISQALKADGHTVAATYSGNDEAAEAFKAETGIAVYKWDVGDFDACQEGIAKVTANHGAIEILVNNAGITRDAPLHKMTPGKWQEVMSTNLTSAFNMSRGVIDSMREQNFGRIINISSINGQKGQFGQANYAATKAGVVGFSKSLALEGARKGITTNVVSPGYINTDMMKTLSEEIMAGIIAQIPAGRLGEADEVARCVSFLAADDAGFINGATLSVNGAQYLA